MCVLDAFQIQNIWWSVITVKLLNRSSYHSSTKHAKQNCSFIEQTWSLCKTMSLSCALIPFWNRGWSHPFRSLEGPFSDFSLFLFIHCSFEIASFCDLLLCKNRPCLKFLLFIVISMVISVRTRLFSVVRSLDVNLDICEKVGKHIFDYSFYNHYRFFIAYFYSIWPSILSRTAKCNFRKNSQLLTNASWAVLLQILHQAVTI